MARLLRRLLYFVRQHRLEAELAEEIESHRAMRQRDLEARGLPAADAEHASRRALGNVTLAREEARAAWIAPWLESVWQDVVYALRVLRRAPRFAGAVVAVMAIGIGAATGVFGLLDALVLESLPVHRPERLVYFDRPSFSYPMFQEVGARTTPVLSSVSAWNLDTLNVEWTTTIEPSEVLAASGNFYQTLGIEANAGRTFGPGDDRIGGGPQGPVAVISDAAWQRRFGRSPTAVGRTLRIEGRTFTIVGVTPARFTGIAPGLAPEITIPLTTLQAAEALRVHSTSWIHLLGRLRDGVTRAQADSAVQIAWRATLEATTPADMPADRRAMYLGRQTRLQSARTGYSRVRNQFQEPLWMLLALVGLLTMVACASAANLLIARALARRREIALRLAIGAGRSRLVRQLVTEVLVWTMLAAIAGLAIAAWGGTGLVAMLNTRDNPIVLDAAPDWRVFGFALALAFVSAAAASIVPAASATSPDTSAAVIRGAGPARGGLLGPRWSSARLLVAAQVALAIVLLAAASLFVRSLQHVLAQDAGVDRNRVLVVHADPGAAGYRGERRTRFSSRLLDRFRALPGVEAASLSQYPPISDEDGAWTQSIEVDGSPLTPEASRRVFFNAVSPEYFRTVGMQILRGRDFAAGGDAGDARVVAINESLARRFFADTDPLGGHITIGRHQARRNLEIVAVVSDAKYQRLQEAPHAIAYLPHVQVPGLEGERLVAEVRAAGAAGPLAETVRRAVADLDPRVPARVETVGERIRISLVRERVVATLATVLGLAALALAGAALYGLLAYAVSRQAHEIGVRLAIGAPRRALVWLVLRECLWLVLVGVAAGLGVALALGRFARTMLYQVSPADPLSLAVAAIVTSMVAGLAALPAVRRAVRVDPVVALRTE